jgi:hypothetical protein
MLLITSLGPFLGMAVFFLLYGNSMSKVLSIVLLFLAAVFFCKAMCLKVSIDEQGITYKGVFSKRVLEWNAVEDVLIVVRERRSVPDYYKFDEWMAAGKKGKSYFLLFRTTNGFPENPMFMFSAPVGEDYISVQFRPKIAEMIQQYFYAKKK